MKIAIYGAGSLGTILGAYITKAGYDIDLIDTNKAHVDALNDKGAKVVGHAQFTQEVSAITPDEMSDRYNLILLLTKQTVNEKVYNKIEQHLAEDAIICTLQNGIPELALAQRFGEEIVMGCTVGWGATWIEPGVSEVTTKEEVWEFDLGRYTGVVDEKVKEVQKILSSMCKTVITENLMGVRWGKLLMNTTFSGMSASLGATFGQVLDDEKAMLCITNLANETINVARANGVKMEIVSTGVDFDKELSFTNEEERIKTLPVYNKVWDRHRNSKASMLQDLEKGIPCEIDYINGIVYNLGKEYKIDTPFNEAVVKIVKDIESGKKTLDFNNLDYFPIL